MNVEVSRRMISLPTVCGRMKPGNHDLMGTTVLRWPHHDRISVRVKRNIWIHAWVLKLLDNAMHENVHTHHVDTLGPKVKIGIIQHLTIR